MVRFWCILFGVLLTNLCLGQATFQSNTSNGNWNTSGSWTLLSGSDGDGIPDSNDDVIITSGHTIVILAAAACDDLSFTDGTLSYNSDQTVSVGGNMSATVNSSISGYSNGQILQVSGNFSINSSITMSVGSIRFEVAGSTTVDGILNLSGFGQARSFGDLTISSGASMTCSGADPYTFTGDLTNNGTFTATSFGTTFDFTGSSNVLAGTGQLSFFEATFDSPASYTNTGNVQIRSSLSGTGSFTNGNGGQLELQNGGPFAVTTFDASATGNTITYTGFGDPTAFSGDYYNLILNKSSGSLSFGSSLTVSNDLTIQSGIVTVGAVTLDIGNDLIMSGGEFTPDNAAAVVNIGGGIIMSGGEYDHNNGDVNVTGAMTLTGGNFFMDGASSTLDAASTTMTNTALTLNDGSWTVTGDFTINTGTTLSNPGTDIAAGGAFALNDGTASFAAGSLSAHGVTIAASKELVITNASFTNTGTTTVNGTLTFDASGGTKSLVDIVVSAGGAWTVSQPEDFAVSGDVTSDGTFTGCPAYGNCFYTLSKSSGSISGTGTTAMRDIVINSPNVYTNTTDLTVANTITGTGTLVNGTNGTLTYQGDNGSGSNFTITNFTASATGNTVVYSRNGNQQLRTTTSADNDYYNVEIDMASAANDVTLAGNITINNQLTLTLGDVVLSSNRLTMADGATISGGSADSFIRINSTGVLRQNYSATGATLAFPIGDSDEYSPITAFTLTSGSFSAGAYVEFDVTDANHPNKDTGNTGAGGDDDGIAATDFISRYWTLTGSGITGEVFDATYQYLDVDINGTEGDMVATLYRQLVSPVINDWLATGMVTAGSNTVSLTDGDNFGDMYAMDDDMGRLPIVLIDFDARATDQGVELNWTTASEESNSLFTIERSEDGFSFEPVLYVDGAGDSDKLIHYRATDKNPQNGLMYYRLKQTDFNGTYSYSELVAVRSVESNTEPDFVIEGNPISSGDLLVVRRNQMATASFTVLDINGQKVAELSLDKSAPERMQISLPDGLQAGTYLLVLIQAGYRITKKLVVR
jgi:hypothetical protein